MHSHESMIATNRFGLGARPGEAAQAAGDPRGWLQQQLGSPVKLNESGLMSSQASLVAFFEDRERRKNAKKAAAAGDTATRPEGEQDFRKLRDIIATEMEKRTLHAVTTPSSFHERLVRFWSNHFTVSVSDPAIVAVAGSFEREAIRPHVTGRFEDMLLAAETHPAMLVYLDNERSVGPNSMAGKRRGLGLNENLAREILELHTVGVDGGYSQQDVLEFARALTGWTISTPRDSHSTGKTWFDERRHEPGSRVIMGKRFTEDGAQQAVSVLRDLANRPQTADHVARRMARHFIADQPPEEAVAALSRSFRDSAGNLGQMASTLVNLDAAWSHDLVKFKSPDEFNLSTLRGLGARSVKRNGLRGTWGALGQSPFSAPSPEGWPDEAEAWLGPDAIRKRLEWSQTVASNVPRILDPRNFVDETLGAFASDTTRFMVRGADSREQGLTLALMSPEFQRR